jgi:hypothetical protein
MAFRKTNTNTTNAQAESSRAPTFDLNDPVLQQIIAQAVAAAMTQKQSQERANDTAKTDTALVKAFEKAGYKNITLFDRTKLLSQQPDVTVLTYNKWIELGRKVKPGEKSLKVRGYHLRLFHKSQTEIMAAEERKAAWKKIQEANARRSAKAGEAQGAQA